MTHTPSHRSKWQRAAFVLLLGSMVQTAFAAVINVSAQDNLNDALARAHRRYAQACLRYIQDQTLYRQTDYH